MSKIEFIIEPNNDNLHRDFHMKIPFLQKVFKFDTYYFWDGQYDTDSYNSLSPLIHGYLTKCKNSLIKLPEKDLIYIPVDFSDQYYGVFRFKRLSSDIFECTYGAVIKTDETMFFENETHTNLSIGNNHFEEDFTFMITINEIVDSFKLQNNSDHH